MHEYDFDAAFQVVKDRLANRSPIYRRSGVAVRDQLVAPILNAVGWHTFDTSEVQPSDSNDDGPCYCVLLRKGDPAVLVEAVKSETYIESADAVQQLAEQSRRLGAGFGLLTNGRVWGVVSSSDGDKSEPASVGRWARIDDEPVAAFREMLVPVFNTDTRCQAAQRDRMFHAGRLRVSR
jgi:predicted type IV restriction endonuclease